MVRPRAREWWRSTGPRRAARGSGLPNRGILRLSCLAVAAAFLGMLAPLPRARAEPLRPTARVVATTRTTAYLDAGRNEGLVEGMRWTAPMGGTTVTVVVVAVSDGNAVVSFEGATGPYEVGTVLQLPPGRSPPPAGPGPRPPPASAPRWVPALASGGLQRVGSEPPQPSVTEAPRRGRSPGVQGEVTARASVGADLGGDSRSSEDLGLSSSMAADLGGGWSWDHVFDLHVAARPESLQVPLQHSETRFDVYLARIGWLSPTGRTGIDVGRIGAAPGTDAGLVDGTRVHLAANDVVSFGAWAGARPDTLDLSPELRAPSAGVVGRLASPRRAPVAARADAAFGVDAWRGALDRAFATGHLALDLPASITFENEVVVDAADEATGRSGARLSRATAWARGRFVDGVLQLRASGGIDDPFVSRSLVDRLAALGGADPVQPVDGRHWFGSGSADVQLLESLVLEVGARADDGDGEFRSLSGDVGLRLFDLGPLGSMTWLRSQVLTGTLVEGVGGEVGWTAPLGTVVHVDTSYAIDRWIVFPAPDPVWAHRGRLALQRRIGERWRTSLSLELATGAGPPRGFGLVLVGCRI